MGKAAYKLNKTIRAEQAAIQKAAKKRGLWSSIGSALLGGVATILTAGAATPAFLTSIAVGGASAAGGHIGNLLAGRSAGGSLTGGRFFQEERKSIGKQIKAGINVGAIKSGMMAGITKALKGFGKGKPSTGETLGKELAAEGQASLGVGTGDRGFMTSQMKANLGKVAASESPIATSSMQRIVRPSAWDALQSSGPQQVAAPLMPEYKTPGAKGFMQRLLPGGESGYQADIPLGEGLSNIEKSWQSLVDDPNYQTQTGAGIKDPITGIVDPATRAWEGRGQRMIPTRDKWGGITSITGDPSTSIKGIGEELIAEGEASLGIGAGDRGFMTPEMKDNLDTALLQSEYDRILPGLRRSSEIAESKRVSEGLKNFEFGTGSPEDTVRGHFPGVDLEDKVPWSPPGVEGSPSQYSPSHTDAPSVRQEQIKQLKTFMADPESAQYRSALWEEGAGISDVNGFSDLDTTRQIVDSSSSSGYASGWDMANQRPRTSITGPEFHITDPLQGMQQQIENLPASFKRGNLPVDQAYMSSGGNMPMDFIDFEDVPNQQKPWQKRIFG